jgi:hypothetical protein
MKFFLACFLAGILGYLVPTLLSGGIGRVGRLFDSGLSFDSLRPGLERFAWNLVFRLHPAPRVRSASFSGNRFERFTLSRSSGFAGGF